MKKVFVCVILLTQFAFAQNRMAPLDFKGKTLVSVSDADMVSSAYVDGKLRERDGDDAISLIPLDGNYKDWKAYETFASNSVAGPPCSVAVSPDGNHAFVVETFTPPSEGGTTFNDLGIGRLLSVYDISNPKNPVQLETMDVGERPVGVTVSPDGQWVAIGYYSNGDKNFGLVPFKEGKLGKVSHFTIPGVDAETAANEVDWHPSGKYLAAVMQNADQIAFMEVDLAGSAPTVSPYGNVVGTGKFPMKGDFTPDGRHYITTCLYWGPDVPGTWIEAPRGQLNSIRFDSDPSDGNTLHSNISTSEAGISPEGFSISHDGTLLATANLERSYLPYENESAEPRITWYSSITLVSIDKETGKLDHLGDFYFQGILPEATVFDADDNYLAVAVYDNFEDTRKGSRIDFWRVVKEAGERPFLVKTDHSVPVARGAHSLVLVK
ncbi:beta-propeller fold lactonase family protein [Aquimarina sp. U1-2]|uniref:lactonase family protein n=1 Tax=Aquimarina sp. U1-2 TaxID=2823141 RepID=UPI001AECDECF|nr:beta-propeller fold lactonase family protein [Aquimarina sp. U1-2]MBP2833753.1 beta-propeller fold lactonase family protein [Aquimarina sp. U1-2]